MTPKFLLRHDSSCRSRPSWLSALCPPPLRAKVVAGRAFRRELGLTAEQSTRLEEIFQKTQPTLRQRMQALDQAEMEFDRLVETRRRCLGPGARGASSRPPARS